MSVITIPKKEYRILLDAKLRYEYLRQVMEKDIFSPPPTKKITEVLGAFRATKKYNQKFLKSLGRGLRRSSYFRT
ncbi:MAG: hypothetical protein HYW89_03255 [Candidatus Sungiibacteriota bacterium]|uniref:Uncharacterized protein n=1 Tax=Candidatus Sungiibacteriota bacterium TaxID=2750080 RepID=A0A7T5RJ12_9BACT|nr:MAG: hypothetical protein HYW89_03255 [Candidatus Sungbacteria bacterium]